MREETSMTRRKALLFARKRVNPAGTVAGRQVDHAGIARRVRRIIGVDKRQHVPFFSRHLGLMSATCLGLFLVGPFLDGAAPSTTRFASPTGRGINAPDTRLGLIIAAGILAWLSFRLAQRQHRRIPAVTLAVLVVYASLLAVLVTFGIVNAFWEFLVFVGDE
jgi:hypothetical protein